LSGLEGLDDSPFFKKLKKVDLQSYACDNSPFMKNLIFEIGERQKFRKFLEVDDLIPEDSDEKSKSQNVETFNDDETVKSFELSDLENEVPPKIGKMGSSLILIKVCYDGTPKSDHRSLGFDDILIVVPTNTPKNFENFVKSETESCYSSSPKSENQNLGGGRRSRFGLKKKSMFSSLKISNTEKGGNCFE